MIMSKKWYVVHAYSGFEKSVQRALLDRISRAGMTDQFGQILVPVEEVVEMKRGTRMFVSGGCFYNVKLDDADEPEESDIFNQFSQLREGDNCPFCNEQLFDVFVDRGAAIGLYELNAMPGIVKRNSS